jgi:hypothetical protein
VFEWHGWPTIVASPGTEDDAAVEARQRDAEARVARAIAGAAGVANETLVLRSANGSVHVWLAGSHNHRDETVIGLFGSIAEAAPGSYGVMAPGAAVTVLFNLHTRAARPAAFHEHWSDWRRRRQAAARKSR